MTFFAAFPKDVANFIFDNMIFSKVVNPSSHKRKLNKIHQTKNKRNIENDYTSICLSQTKREKSYLLCKGCTYVYEVCTYCF